MQFEPKIAEEPAPPAEEAPPARERKKVKTKGLRPAKQPLVPNQ